MDLSGLRHPGKADIFALEMRPVNSGRLLQSIREGRREARCGEVLNSYAQHVRIRSYYRVDFAITLRCRSMNE